MLLTTSVKLITTSEQKQKLLKSMYKFNVACNWVSKYCFDNKLFSKSNVHKKIYKKLREKFDLPSQIAIRIIGRVCDSYKINKNVLHVFKKNSSIEYDLRSLSWNKLESISILSTEGRLKMPVSFGEYANLHEKIIRNSAKLIYKNKEFYLHVSAENKEDILKDVSEFLGIDLGIVNLATSSENQIFSGASVDSNRKRYGKLRAKLQKVGSKSAKRHLKKISGKERRFKKNTNHVISKQIVLTAKALNKGIALEELKFFKKTVRKNQREQFGKWSFGELSCFIEYKAKLSGVKVAKVDPRYTSQTCSKCSHCEKSNRKSQDVFKCKSCGFTLHADLNAAINIAARAVVNQPIVANYCVKQ